MRGAAIVPVLPFTMSLPRYRASTTRIESCMLRRVEPTGSQSYRVRDADVPGEAGASLMGTSTTCKDRGMSRVQ